MVDNLREMFMFHPIVFKAKDIAFGYMSCYLNKAWCMV
jgi:hypothetical protein